MMPDAGVSRQRRLCIKQPCENVISEKEREIIGRVSKGLMKCIAEPVAESFCCPNSGLS